MLKKVVVYKNTGFDGINIPASPTVLATAAGNNKKEYSDTYFIREDIDNPIIRINDSYDNLKYVDYVEIKNTNDTERMFYFAVPKALAKNTTAIYLQLDALTTMGGAANLTYTSGWQTRGHVSTSEDVLFGNVADEDFMPSQELKISNMQNIDAGTDTGENIIVTTSVNLSDLYTGTESTGFSEYAAKVFEGKINPADKDAVMYWPAIRSCKYTTSFNVRGDVFFVPSTCAYSYHNTNVKDALNKLYSIGQLSLQSSYKLPRKWFTATFDSSDSGRYKSISGYAGTKNTSIAYERSISEYTIKNKKCQAMFRKIILQSIATGDICIKKPSELYDKSSTVSILLWADPSPIGKPYARFSNINSSLGSNQILYDGCVKGSQWVNNQLVFEGASGGVWESINAGFANANAQRGYDQYMTNIRAQHEKTTRWAHYEAAMYPYEQMQQGMNVASGIAGTLMQATQGNVGGAINGVMGTMSSAIDMGKMMTMKENVVIPNFQTDLNLNKANSEFEQQKLQQQINENAIGQLRNNTLVSPTVMFSPDAGLSLYGYNYFIAYEIVMQDDDVKALDKYFQLFGYAGLHRPLDKSCFKKRSHYNYVQAYDISIDSSWPMRVRQKGIAQLNSGVRCWLERPNAAAYENN